MKRKVRNVMNIIVRACEEKDLPEMIRIWNEIVEDETICGCYILHPNNEAA